MTARGADPLDFWRRAFALTYSAELRAERKSRPRSVVDVDPERYRAFRRARRGLRRLSAARRSSGAGGMAGGEGKGLSVLRLAKASATFAGGADYIAWKINRHAGTDIAIEAVAAALAAARRDQPFAAAAEVRGGSLAVRASAAETALASAPTVNGLRSSSWPRRSSLSPSPT